MFAGHLQKNKERIKNLKKREIHEEDQVGISKYKSIFAEGYVQKGIKKRLWLKDVKNAVLWAFAISYFNGEEIVGTFYEKELRNTNKKQFRVEKAIKRKGKKTIC